MSLSARPLASGSGWCASDVVCTAGPRVRPFAEQHDWACIALVTAGTFSYRSSHGSATLAPGALLLGNSRYCFECGHEHGIGDRCLSFHFAPEFLESVAAATPGARRADFSIPRLPPLPALLPVVATAEAARDGADQVELEEAALRLAGAVATTLADTDVKMHAPSWRDERRITAALRRIEAEVDETLSLAELARTAVMSPYHFLRTFRAVVGVTPHQFILHTRLHRAAVRLCLSTDSISTIAFAAGFGDLSTFNRRFQKLMGSSPSAYRTGRSRLRISPAAR
jgi:AraC family transcriptional regulator